MSSAAGWMRHNKLVGKIWTRNLEGCGECVHFCFTFGFWQLRNAGRVPFSENEGQLQDELKNVPAKNGGGWEINADKPSRPYLVGQEVQG